MIAFYLMGMLPALAGAAYLVFYIFRILTHIFHLSMTWYWWIITVAIALGLSVPAMNFFNVWAVAYYYFLAISIVLDIIARFTPAKAALILRSGLVSAVVVAVVIAYGYYNMNHVVETDFSVTTNKNVNLKILQISDLHTDQVINPEKLKTYVKRMNKLNADIVVLTGDIFDEATPKKDMVKATKVLGTIKNKMGIYYVFGNHDDQKYGNTMNDNTDRFNASDIVEQMNKNKITVLDDQSVNIGKNITIVGRKDASYSRKSSKELLKSLDKKRYIIVLDHQPLDMQANAKNGADLQLSGHTHGGQIWPTGTLQAIMTHTMRYGKKTIGDFTIITSSGIAGWGYPIKIGAPAEYAVIQVKHK